jgi:hypothetical protein
MMILLSHIWKSRNSLIFYNHDSSAQDIVVRRVITDMDAWSYRYNYTSNTKCDYDTFLPFVIFPFVILKFFPK